MSGSSSIYFDCPVRSTHSGTIEAFEFHPQFPLLAISLTKESAGEEPKGIISIYDQSGYPLPGSDVTLEETTCDVLAWHPSKRFVAIGWKNGSISVRSEDQQSATHTVDKQHTTAITALIWVEVAPGAVISRLITADKNGQVMIWKYDIRSKTPPSVMCHCNAKDFGAINCSILRTIQQPVHDMATLARAAAEGDERALELLVSGRIKNQRGNTPDAISCFLGSENGQVFHLDEKGNYVVLFDSNHYGAGGVRRLLIGPTQKVLVAVTSSLTIYAFALESQTSMKELGSVRLPGIKIEVNVIWAGDSAVAIPTGQNVIRMFSTSTFDNFSLELPEQSESAAKGAGSMFDASSGKGNEKFSVGIGGGGGVGDGVLSVAYSSHTKLLVAGCKSGKLYFWKYQPNSKHTTLTTADEYDLKSDWLLEKTVDSSSHSPNDEDGERPVNVKSVHWCENHSYLAALASSGVTIYEQAEAATAYHSEMSCVQLSSKELAIRSYRFDLKTKLIQSTLQLRGVAVSQQAMVVWDGENACVYEVNMESKTVNKTAEFQCASSIMCIYEQSIFSVEPTKLQVRNLQGVVKQLLSHPSTDKSVVVTSMNINGSNLVLSTISGQIMLYNLSKREAKIDRPARNIKELISKLTIIKSCKVNTNGKLISLIVEEDLIQGPNTSEPSSRLYVWDTESDSIVFHDFSTDRVASASRPFAADTAGVGGGGQQPDDDDLMSQDSNDPFVSSANNDVKRDTHSAGALANKGLGGRVPISHFWSSDDPRLLTCEAMKMESKSMSTSEQLGLSTTSNLESSLNLGSNTTTATPIVIAVFFVDIPTAPLLMLKDSFPMPPHCTKLIGFDVPFHYCLSKIYKRRRKNSNKANTSPVVRLPMRDFAGFSDCDSTTKKAMIDFSFHIAYGNMDEAFRAIKLIKNESVWENMCRMCVKNQNLSVAKMCLGNMRNLRATHALRKAEQADMEVPAQTAMLAIALGMREEAEKLLKSCGRHDLLNEIHQSQCEWGRAISVAEKHDRIHLTTTQYNYARYLESQSASGTADQLNLSEDSAQSTDDNGKESFGTPAVEKAIQLYEKASTHHFDVPRMLSDNYSNLLSYVNHKNEPALYKWWAQFCESTGSIELALEYYEKANDILSMVRVLCYLEKYDEAMQLCNREGSLEDDDDPMGPYGDPLATSRSSAGFLGSSSEPTSTSSQGSAVSLASATKAACYYLAQQFESQYSSDQNPKTFQQAITYFMRAEAYTNACRLCKDAGDFDQLKNVASLGSMTDKLDAAKFLEAQDTQDCRDKALQLYSMAGQGMKVAELTRGEQKAAVMDSIVAHLDESSSSPEQLREFAKFFRDTGLYEKAINLYIQAKDYDAALTLLEEAAAVDITDEMAEKLCPDKSDKSIDTRQRNQLLTRLAYICQSQQKYTLAYKKFQQAGDINQGFKALLKSGDVELIFKTAKVSRKPDLMIDAANYFKTLQWVQAEDVVMKIIELYQKAKAYELLALFYISCAELEMDQYQAYDKAIDALNEAEKELSKAVPNSKDPARIQSALTQIKHRIQLISTFLENDVTTTDKEQVARMNGALRTILEDDSYQRFPRERDIYTRMLANFLATEQNQKAFHCLETLHGLEEGVRALRRLFPGGSDSGPNNEQIMMKVNMLVDKVCERVERPELADKFKIGVSYGKKGNKSLNETDEEIGGGDESGEEGIERELDEDLDD
ncbi:intraflagellar transport protein 140 homolog isoform X3 [Convolutriloba macropyga]|uniref:intraflagellar transport protein 140 homolog isoform X3 n=1 Tax=Convolutriloba macropyga TaxID=536237 RepID=UPI003F5269D8